MTPEETYLYSLHLFDIGDIVEIEGSELFGEIVGLQIQIGNEDRYLVSFLDGTGTPRREWWPASSLESADDDEPDVEALSNIIQFPCECHREENRAAKRATRH